MVAGVEVLEAKLGQSLLVDSHLAAVAPPAAEEVEKKEAQGLI
jgi:hypothetical protein